MDCVHDGGALLVREPVIELGKPLKQTLPERDSVECLGWPRYRAERRDVFMPNLAVNAMRLDNGRL